MKRTPWSWLLVILTIVVGTVFLFGNMPLRNSPVTLAGTTVPPVPTLHAEWLAEGKLLYAQHCASCHGIAMEGVADWKKPLADGSLRSPPHDSSGHTWHHEDSLLLSIIAHGGDPTYNSKMPAFQETLTEEQMAAILEFIKSSWGREEREFQWWMTATRDGIKPTLRGQR